MQNRFSLPVSELQRHLICKQEVNTTGLNELKSVVFELFVVLSDGLSLVLTCSLYLSWQMWPTTVSCISGSQIPLRQYHYVNRPLNWSEAQLENYKDLAMIENQEENTDAQNTKLSNYRVWIGLYREPWTWSDGSKSSFRNWLPNTGLNNINENQHCITENPQHQWADESCNIPWVFVCHQGDFK
uniref:C-type lectin domain-containing protein n=1 Tax=Oryzias latipes TaxID=8090 RepID=A0A3P9KSG0_ORYLA